MFAQTLIDWWFMPWSYGMHRSDASLLPHEAGMLGQRDGYRLWCRQTDVVPEFPALCDPGWTVATCTDGAQFVATARLFSGLIAARHHDQEELSSLSFADRKWCMSVAAIQPLQHYHQTLNLLAVPLEMRGLCQLAMYLAHGFPGMWSRLRMLLEPATATVVDRFLQDMLGIAIVPLHFPARAQRCWRLCRSRAELASAETEPVAATKYSLSIQ